MKHHVQVGWIQMHRHSQQLPCHVGDLRILQSLDAIYMMVESKDIHAIQTKQLSLKTRSPNQEQWDTVTGM